MPLQLRDHRLLLGDPDLQLGDRPLLGRHERPRLLVGRSGRGPILHTPTRLTQSRHARPGPEQSQFWE